MFQRNTILIWAFMVAICFGHYDGICPENEVYQISQPIKCQLAWDKPNYPGDYPGCSIDKPTEKHCACISNLFNGLEVKRLFASPVYRAPCVVEQQSLDLCAGELYVGDAIFPIECQEWCPDFGADPEFCDPIKQVLPGCACEAGLVRNPGDGACIWPGKCPLICANQNERLRKMSDFPCENTCTGFSYCPQTPSPCICQEGYIRTRPEGLCVAREVCLPEREHTTCSGRCGMVVAAHREPISYGFNLNREESLYKSFGIQQPMSFGLAPGLPSYRACSCDLLCGVNGDCCSDFVSECLSQSKCPCGTVEKCRCYHQAKLVSHHSIPFPTDDDTIENLAKKTCGC